MPTAQFLEPILYAVGVVPPLKRSRLFSSQYPLIQDANSVFKQALVFSQIPVMKHSYMTHICQIFRTFTAGMLVEEWRL